MEIKDLGEFGLINRLTKDIQPINNSTIMGVGDDAAVLHYSDKETLVSSQMFMEGVQFDLTYIDMEHLAYKVAMIAMSNIFAMNGQPRQLIVSLGLGKRFKEEGFEIGDTESPIIPLYVRDLEKTFAATAMAFEAGVFINPVVPPACHPTDTLVRIALMATHTHEQVDRAVAALVGVFRKLEILK